jgi:hypothetical protein
MAGIFRQLMHVNDMRDGSQFIDGAKYSGTLQSGFQSDQKKQRGSKQNRGVRGGVQFFDAKAIPVDFHMADHMPAQIHGHTHDYDDSQSNACMLFGQPLYATGGFFCDSEKFLANFPQTRSRKSLFYAIAQSLECGNGLVRIEASIHPQLTEKTFPVVKRDGIKQSSITMPED